MTPEERKQWGADLVAGSRVALRGVNHSSMVAPFSIHLVLKANRKTVLLDKHPTLVPRDWFLLEPVTTEIRQAVAKFHLTAWSRFSAADQIFGLTLQQQQAVRSLVSRMAADPAVLS